MAIATTQHITAGAERPLISQSWRNMMAYGYFLARNDARHGNDAYCVMHISQDCRAYLIGCVSKLCLKPLQTSAAATCSLEGRKHTQPIRGKRGFTGPEDPAYIKYQAESPDEAALVAAGKAFGFFFHRRNHTSVLVREPKGDAEVEMEYEILNILEFDSTRKRMSVICRNPEGNIMLYCKVCCRTA